MYIICRYKIVSVAHAALLLIFAYKLEMFFGISMVHQLYYIRTIIYVKRYKILQKC